MRKDRPLSPYVGVGVIPWLPLRPYYKKADVRNAIVVASKCSWQQITSRSRIPHILEARLLAYYYLYRYSNMTYKEVGKYMMKDHATVMSGLQTIEGYLATYSVITHSLCIRIVQYLDYNIQSSKNHSPHDTNEDPGGTIEGAGR